MNKNTSNEKISSYKSAVEKNTDGKFYTGDLEKMSSNIVNEIKDTKTSLLKSGKKTYVTDHPEILFGITLLLFTILIILEKIIKIV